jgi:DNA invertase Pin-like site-specific DNA recombinase
LKRHLDGVRGRRERRGCWAALAEKERAMISSRTKAALAAAKERGVMLGGPKLAEARHVADISTARGGRWHAMTVRNVLARA